MLRAQVRTELSGVQHEITTVQEAIDRYMTAFEQRKLDADACGERVRALKARLDQLTWRRQDLEHDLTEGPVGRARRRSASVVAPCLRCPVAAGTERL